MGGFYFGKAVQEKFNKSCCEKRNQTLGVKKTNQPAQKRGGGRRGKESQPVLQTAASVWRPFPERFQRKAVVPGLGAWLAPVSPADAPGEVAQPGPCLCPCPCPALPGAPSGPLRVKGGGEGVRGVFVVGFCCGTVEATAPRAAGCAEGRLPHQHAHGQGFGRR